MRLTKCPVCKADIPHDYGMSMDIGEWCPVDGNHYAFHMNFFATSVRVLDEKYDLEKKEDIEKWRDFISHLE